ncbi:hypothetical protein F0562_023829 [Nyssa sinensis]|uniref:Uncharacterized protein n=1 Tax=Nyssa sinensis TaxID=561372 RepID=A0A5J5BLT1_9ASTE|nr:hypothetical protein F0562_023829 [Nyssa sinensis]
MGRMNQLVEGETKGTVLQYDLEYHKSDNSQDMAMVVGKHPEADLSRENSPVVGGRGTPSSGGGAKRGGTRRGRRGTLPRGRGACSGAVSRISRGWEIIWYQSTSHGLVCSFNLCSSPRLFFILKACPVTIASTAAPNKDHHQSTIIADSTSFHKPAAAATSLQAAASSPFLPP